MIQEEISKREFTVMYNLFINKKLKILIFVKLEQVIHTESSFMSF